MSTQKRGSASLRWAGWISLLLIVLLAACVQEVPAPPVEIVVTASVTAEPSIAPVTETNGATAAAVISVTPLPAGLRFIEFYSPM